MGFLEWGIIAAGVLVIGFAVFVAIVIGLIAASRRSKLKSPTVLASAPLVAPVSSRRHAGHDFYDSFKALEESAIADRLLVDFGAKGADRFSDKLADYTTKTPPAAAPATTPAPVPNPPPPPAPPASA